MGLLFSLDARTEPTACFLFYLVMKIEVLSIFCKKKKSKNIKMLQGELTNSQILLCKFLDEYTGPHSQSHPFFWREAWNFRKIRDGSDF